jgi:hypothetical protein
LALDHNTSGVTQIFHLLRNHAEILEALTLIWPRNRGMNRAASLLQPLPGTGLMIPAYCLTWRRAFLRLSRDHNPSGATAIFHLLQNLPDILQTITPMAPGRRRRLQHQQQQPAAHPPRGNRDSEHHDMNNNNIINLLQAHQHNFGLDDSNGDVGVLGVAAAAAAASVATRTPAAPQDAHVYGTLFSLISNIANETNSNGTWTRILLVTL